MSPPPPFLMYADPLRSQFRRPWSPDYYEQQRREPSDVSVEALDLADYAMTLDTSTRLSQSMHPVNTHDSPLIAPSLESSNNIYYTAPRNPNFRPFSLPPTASLASHAASCPPPPRIVEQTRIQSPSEEIDISHFPKWSQGWYNNKSNNNMPQNHIADPDADIYTPIPPSSFGLAGLHQTSVFDPGYKHDPNASDPYLAFDTRSPPLYSSAHDSSRDLLPWSNGTPQYDLPLEPALREERMRMLEKEFGNKQTKKDPLLDQNGKPLVGTVDDQGRLVTVGPKKRVFIRVLQISLALAAAVPSIYAALAIKSSNPKDPPPPANKPPAYVLYVISVISVFTLLYLFVIRPCCCIRNKPSSSKHPLAASGMMVLPMNGPGGKKPKNSKAKRRTGQQDVQVNLIVDPTAFKPPNVSSSEDSEDDSDDLDEAKKTKHKKKKRTHKKRRGIFEGLAMEKQWLAARSWLRKMTMVDVAGFIIWGTTFVFVLTGKRCPSGGFKGWCNAYNVSTAAACFLCVAFGVSIFFDVQDLYASKISPRIRT